MPAPTILQDDDITQITLQLITSQLERRDLTQETRHCKLSAQSSPNLTDILCPRFDESPTWRRQCSAPACAPNVVRRTIQFAVLCLLHVKGFAQVMSGHSLGTHHASLASQRACTIQHTASVAMTNLPISPARRGTLVVGTVSSHHHFLSLRSPLPSKFNDFGSPGPLDQASSSQRGIPDPTPSFLPSRRRQTTRHHSGAFW